MKKILPLITLLTCIICNAQCPAPSNFTLSILDATSAQLSWTENGIADTWEIAIIPDFIVGTPLPSDALYVTTSNPFIVTGLSQLSECNVFFVRSRCSATDVSPWAGLASFGCDAIVYNYLATLSNDTFSLQDNSGLQLFPNPSNNIVQIKCNSIIDKIRLFDSLGKEILIQTQNDKINIENLSKGVYLIEVYTENKKLYRKLVKE
ncbi:T9SS type A sorting domain-containing protein [Flavobacterium aciduliphilum]|uniref:Putative secreted protein (Por secretion system target) n=1 Tax=Flavobacterium aciduliphilum TaxID=1101402 RepID=A0A328Z0A5_9FLAO|nr:T9SS type A sorting domain-containing protein [Flavobacterium aciduliphilum]RAR75726.1 putative secreted protein (Por secretion system target) [Flavobacterium aciduliphilum]